MLDPSLRARDYQVKWLAVVNFAEAIVLGLSDVPSHWGDMACNAQVVMRCPVLSMQLCLARVWCDVEFLL